MKIKDGFTLRNIAGSDIVVPIGNASKIFNGMITLNDSGAFLWSALQKDTTIDEVVARLTDEYEVSTEQATADVQKFVDMLRENDLIDE